MPQDRVSALTAKANAPINPPMSQHPPQNTTHIYSQDPDRDVWRSLQRGWRQLCPSCGKGAMYWKYLKVNNACPCCGTELHHHRADDAPPYFVMSITGHVVVGGVLVLEKLYGLNMWIQLAIWMPALILLSLWLLPRVKGSLVGYQWALRMHGFGNTIYDDPDLGLAPGETKPATT
jgi:uncharacterized protein (DUF983 family)